MLVTEVIHPLSLKIIQLQLEVCWYIVSCLPPGVGGIIFLSKPCLI